MARACAPSGRHARAMCLGLADQRAAARRASPRRCSTRTPLGPSWMPAPCRREGRRAARARSALRPVCASASASASPPMPPPAIRIGAGAAIGRSRRLDSGRGGFGRLTRQPSGSVSVGRQARVVDVERRAVGAQDLAVGAHVQIDVRMIVRRAARPCTGTPSRRWRFSPRPGRWRSGERGRLPCARLRWLRLADVRPDDSRSARRDDRGGWRRRPGQPTEHARADLRLRWRAHRLHRRGRGRARCC